MADEPAQHMLQGPSAESDPMTGLPASLGSTPSSAPIFSITPAPPPLGLLPDPGLLQIAPLNTGDQSYSAIPAGTPPISSAYVKPPLQPAPSRPVSATGLGGIPVPNGVPPPMEYAAVRAPAEPSSQPAPQPSHQQSPAGEPFVRSGLQPANPALGLPAVGAIAAATLRAPVGLPLTQPQPPIRAPLAAPGQAIANGTGSRPLAPVAGAGVRPPAPPPPGFGFTNPQLTCLRQQIMTFRRLKVHHTAI